MVSCEKNLPITAMILQIDTTAFVVGDIKLFQLDKEKLKGKSRAFLHVNHVYIKKEKNGERYYFTAFVDKGLTKQVGEANIRKSEIGMVNIKTDFQKCGIGSILIYLCILDKDANPIHGNTYINTKNEFNGQQSILRFAQRCTALIKVFMQAEKYGGNAYFYAARAANYNALIVFGSNKNKVGVHSERGHIYDLDTAWIHYNNDDLDNTYWYFCKL